MFMAAASFVSPVPRGSQNFFLLTEKKADVLSGARDYAGAATTA